MTIKMRKNKRPVIFAISGFFIVALIICMLFIYTSESKYNPVQVMTENMTTLNFMTANCFNDDSLSHHEAITITNSSNEGSYLWIGREPTQDRSIEDLISNYFDKIPSGTSTSFNEIIKMDHVHEMEVGYTFIKYLDPKETFIIVLPDDSRSQVFYLERIVFTSRKSVHRVLNHPIPEKYLFKENIIVLTPTAR